jgi:hypothetical protein
MAQNSTAQPSMSLSRHAAGNSRTFEYEEKPSAGCRERLASALCLLHCLAAACPASLQAEHSRAALQSARHVVQLLLLHCLVTCISSSRPLKSVQRSRSVNADSSSLLNVSCRCTTQDKEAVKKCR